MMRVPRAITLMRHHASLNIGLVGLLMVGMVMVGMAYVLKLMRKGQNICPEHINQQHEEITQLHTDLESLGLQWLSLPRLSPVTWEKLKDTVDGMSSIYSEHIQIEEHEIFPKAAEFLSPEELATVGDEMSARRKD